MGSTPGQVVAHGEGIGVVERVQIRSERKLIAELHDILQAGCMLIVVMYGCIKCA